MIDLANFVDQHFTVKGRSGDEYSVLCPSHHDRNASMRINVAKGAFFCHGCGIRGGTTALGKLVGVRLRIDKTEQALDLVMSKLRKLSRAQSHGRPVYLPESILARYDYPTRYWTAPIDEDGRDFTEDTVETFDLGYDIIDDCAIIPVRDRRGRLLGVTRRFLDPDADPKYKDPKGFEKAHNLFASWLAAEHPSPEVVLVEGPLDCIKVWQSGHPSVAQYGSYITPEQIKILKRMGTTTIVLFYDNDSGGRKATQWSLGYRYEKVGSKRFKHYDPSTDLRKHFIVKQVSWKGVRADDPGKLSDTMIDSMICKSRLLV